MSKKSPTIISEEQRKKAIEEIINFFSTERSEEIGVIAAEDILDMILNLIGADIYNKGVDDTMEYIKERIDEINIDLESTIKK